MLLARCCVFGITGGFKPGASCIKKSRYVSGFPFNLQQATGHTIVHITLQKNAGCRA
jgi:hypothetical protein